MRFEHFGLTKMLVVLAPFALALSFAGCSGESSTAADGSSDEQENSAIDDDSSGKDDSSSSSKKDDSSGEEDSSSSSKKDDSSDEDDSSSSSKKDDSSGKDSSSSSSKKKGSSGKDRFANVKIGKCDFKEDDEVWAYAYTDTEDDNEFKAFSFTSFDGENLKDSLYRVISGPEMTRLCKQMKDKQKLEDGFLGMRITTISWCEDDVMYITETAVGKMDDVSRTEVFEAVMEECLSYNGEGDNSSSSSAGRSSSSSAKKAKSSSSSAATPQEGSTCNFEKDDDVWVMDIDGVGLTTLTWNGNSYTVVSEMSVKLVDEATCEASVENADPEDHAYCEGSVYKSRAERFVDDDDRDDVYEYVMALCAL